MQECRYFPNSRTLLLFFFYCPSQLLAKGQSKQEAEGRKRRKCSKSAKFAIKNFLLKSKQQYTGQILFLHLPVKFLHVPIW